MHDGDSAYPAQLIPEYLENLDHKRYRLYTESRFSEMEKRTISFIHRVGNKIL